MGSGSRSDPDPDTDLTPIRYATREDEVLERMARPGACFLVAEEQGVIAGTVFSTS